MKIINIDVLLTEVSTELKIPRADVENIYQHYIQKIVKIINTDCSISWYKSLKIDYFGKFIPTRRKQKGIDKLPEPQKNNYLKGLRPILYFGDKANVKINK